MAVHNRLASLASPQMVDERPAWLWVRHQDAETGFRTADRALTGAVRRLYDVDWPFVEGLA
jgi:ABC-type iron transport system FetAB ATPase subunit